MRLSSWIFLAGGLVLIGEWSLASSHTSAPPLWLVNSLGKLENMTGGAYRPGLILVGIGAVTRFGFGK